MITILLIIATVLLALSGMAIMRLCKVHDENRITIIDLKSKSYDNYQLFLDETKAHEVALQEIEDLEESLAQVKPHAFVIDAYEREAEALREAAREADRDAGTLKRKLSTAENNLAWLSSYSDKTRVSNRKLKLELSVTRAKLKYLEVTDGYFTLRAYKSEGYGKIYVVGHGYLKAPITQQWPYLLRNGDFVSCGDLVKELRQQIKDIKAASFIGVK